MSNVRKTKKINEGEAKQKKPRAKKQPPTKEETMKMLLESSAELKQIIQDLKEDESRLQSLSLKKVPELIKETLTNLAEDLEDIEVHYEELKSGDNVQ